jgi:hypothetical protein
MKTKGGDSSGLDGMMSQLLNGILGGKDDDLSSLLGGDKEIEKLMKSLGN